MSEEVISIPVRMEDGQARLYLPTLTHNVGTACGMWTMTYLTFSGSQLTCPRRFIMLRMAPRKQSFERDVEIVQISSDHVRGIATMRYPIVVKGNQEGGSGTSTSQQDEAATPGQP